MAMLKDRSWDVIAKELTMQPTKTQAQNERFQELTIELLKALRILPLSRKPVRSDRDPYFIKYDSALGQNRIGEHDGNKQRQTRTRHKEQFT